MKRNVSFAATFITGLVAGIIIIMLLAFTDKKEVFNEANKV